MHKYLIPFVVCAALLVACNENDAINRGVGEQCVTTADCPNNEVVVASDVNEPAILLECLTEFKGGYCGLKDCTAHTECPDGSRCVIADSGTNYCYLICVDKVDCNWHRDADNESNCVGNTEQVDGAKDVKVCVPPVGS